MAVVLIVDDDADVVEAVSMALAFEGYDVVAADDAATALDLARTRCPTLTLVDYRIPGVDVASLIGKLRQLSTATIALCTGVDRPEELLAATGADRLLAKPFAVDDLLELARSAAAHEAPVTT